VAAALERIGPLHCRSDFTVKTPPDPAVQKARSRPRAALSSFTVMASPAVDTMGAYCGFPGTKGDAP
jgi:hypothetical protein